MLCLLTLFFEQRFFYVFRQRINEISGSALVALPEQ
jgi:hypothetical protein